MIFIQSESCITIQFDNTEAHHCLIHIKNSIAENPFPGWVESVPTFTTLSIYVNPLVVSVEDKKLWGYLETLIRDAKIHATVESSAKNIIKIPVCYGHKYGPDLEWAAQNCHISEEEFISIHSAQQYKVYMLGFVPGFPYLGEVPEKIRLPRMSQARAKVAAGSVGIAGLQTGIYPSDIPGGWPIVGRTPFKIFDTEKQHPFLLSAGDFVQFYPVSEEDFKRLNQHAHD